MDLRGAAQMGMDYFVTAGGMEPGQQVSKKTYAYSWAYILDATDILAQYGFRVSPNPAQAQIRIECTQPCLFRLVGMDGRIHGTATGLGEVWMDVKHLAAGTYFVQAWAAGKMLGTEKVVLGF